MFIIKFKPPMWNYYNTESHRTNNECGNYNKRLNSYFTPIKLINILTTEDNSISNKYLEMVNECFLTKRKRKGPSDYMSCLPYFFEKNDELKGDINSEKKNN